MLTLILRKLNLLDVPVEILAEILCHLDHLDLLRSSAVRTPSFPRRTTGVFRFFSHAHKRTHVLSFLIRFARSSTRSSGPPSRSNTASSLLLTGSSTVPHRRTGADDGRAARPAARAAGRMASPAPQAPRGGGARGALPRVRARGGPDRQGALGVRCGVAARRFVVAQQRQRRDAPRRRRPRRSDQGLCARPRAGPHCAL
jgi:hypothetical protein